MQAQRPHWESLGEGLAASAARSKTLVRATKGRMHEVIRKSFPDQALLDGRTGIAGLYKRSDYRLSSLQSSCQTANKGLTVFQFATMG